MNDPANNSLKAPHRSIARRLIIYILLFSSVITLISTSYQLFLDYSRDIGAIQNNMRQIELSYLDSIIRSMWVTDEELLTIQADGILRLPDMQYIEIKTNSRQVFFAGTIKKSNIIQKEFDLSFHYKGKDISLGTLTVAANVGAVYQRLMSRVTVILLTQAIKTFLVSMFILFLFYYLIGRHLNILAQYVAEFNLSGLDRQLTLQRKKIDKESIDELDLLVSGINQMRINLLQDITERKQAEEDLIKNEERYRQLYENANEAIFIAQGGKLVLLNPMTSKIFGHSDTDLLEKQFTEFIHPEDKEIVLDRHFRRLKGEEVLDKYLFRIIRSDSRIRWVELNSVLIEWEGKPATLNFLNDTTKRKQAEVALLRNQYYLTKAQEIGNIGTFELDIKKNTLLWTDENYKIFGVPLGTEMNYELFINCVHPDDRDYVNEQWNAGLQRVPYDIEHRIIVGNSIKWVREKADIDFDAAGAPSMAIGFSQDITDRKKAEEKIKSSLLEKETLLHEIHHRVKNNMQVIASLLKLQANSIDDRQVKDVLKESQSRVYAMSAVHETIHGSENLSQINLKTYLAKITTSIFQTYSVNQSRIKLITDVDEALININHASPVSLIINELISNSLKYAFPNERVGKIFVSLKKLDQEFELIIEDDGVGMPNDFDWKNASSLGIRLVRTLAENQLDGSIDMENNDGSKFIIKFNIDT